MDSGTLVLVHLVSPKEKYWGVLQKLETAGLTMRGITVELFDDWALVRQGRLSTMSAPDSFVKWMRERYPKAKI